MGICKLPSFMPRIASSMAHKFDKHEQLSVLSYYLNFKQPVLVYIQLDLLVEVPGSLTKSINLASPCNGISSRGTWSVDN